MYFALDVIAISLLMSAFIASERGSKSFACAVVLFVYLLAMRMQEAEFYPAVLDMFGYYVSQSFFEVLVVVLLLIKPSKEAVLIMGLCLLGVACNFIAWGIESTGFYMGGIAEAVMWALFAAQMAVLFSGDLTDVIHGYFAKHSMVRNMYPSHSKISSKG